MDAERQQMIAKRRIDCPKCKSHKTHPILETMWMRYCDDCDEEWDLRSQDEIEDDDYYDPPSW